MDYIASIKISIGRETKKNFRSMRPGDIYQTYADSSALGAANGFTPNIQLQTGIDRTEAWFKEYYKL